MNVRLRGGGRGGEERDGAEVLRARGESVVEGWSRGWEVYPPDAWSVSNQTQLYNSTFSLSSHSPPHTVTLYSYTLSQSPPLHTVTLSSLTHCHTAHTVTLSSYTLSHSPHCHTLLSTLSHSPPLFTLSHCAPVHILSRPPLFCLCTNKIHLDIDSPSPRLSHNFPLCTMKCQKRQQPALKQYFFSSVM